MDLDQAEVDAYIAHEKLVIGNGPMEWDSRPGCSRWRGVVEIDAVRVGEVWLIANPDLPRAWHSTLSFHKAVVYRFEDQPPPARHQNRGCPGQFPARFGAVPHEHFWVEGRDLHCARPVDGVDEGDHHAYFQAFCARANLIFGPEYTSPIPPDAQMELGP